MPKIEILKEFPYVHGKEKKIYRVGQVVDLEEFTRPGWKEHWVDRLGMARLVHKAARAPEPEPDPELSPAAAGYYKGGPKLRPDQPDVEHPAAAAPHAKHEAKPHATPHKAAEPAPDQDEPEAEAEVAEADEYVVDAPETEATHSALIDAIRPLEMKSRRGGKYVIVDADGDVVSGPHTKKAATQILEDDRAKAGA